MRIINNNHREIFFYYLVKSRMKRAKFTPKSRKQKSVKNVSPPIATINKKDIKRIFLICLDTKLSLSAQNFFLNHNLFRSKVG